MSMLSARCDELRELAVWLDDEFYDVEAAKVRDAADTILELRDDLQRANAAVQDAEHDESMAWDRVRKAEAENAKLRQQLADVVESMGRVEERCAKLRKLAKKLKACNSSCGRCIELYGVCEHETELQELGIEVD